MNELTDELQISLEKLHETEVELKTLNRSESNSQLLPKNSGLCELGDNLRLRVFIVCVRVFSVVVYARQLKPVGVNERWHK